MLDEGMLELDGARVEVGLGLALALALELVGIEVVDAGVETGVSAPAEFGAYPAGGVGEG